MPPNLMALDYKIGKKKKKKTITKRKETEKKEDFVLRKG